jgi:hypothetical protein
LAGARSSPRESWYDDDLDDRVDRKIERYRNPVDQDRSSFGCESDLTHYLPHERAQCDFDAVMVRASRPGHLNFQDEGGSAEGESVRRRGRSPFGL